MHKYLIPFQQVGMMFSSLLVVYPAYHFWSYRRLVIKDASKRRLWDYFWLVSYIIYICKCLICSVEPKWFSHSSS